MSGRRAKWRNRWSLPQRHRSVGGRYQLQIPRSTTLAETARQRPFLSNSCKRDFLLKCWHLNLAAHDEKHLRPYQTYFSHYEESCRHIQSSLRDFTHEQFCLIIQLLRQHNRNKCEEEIENLIGPNRDIGAAQDCIQFVGQAILLLDLSKWRASETLPSFIAREIATASTQTDQFRLPSSFNARNLEKVAGIEVSWTWDLSRHLQIGSKDTNLEVFHMVTALDLYESSPFKDLFPPAFIDETRWTIALMLPEGDTPSMKWFQNQQRTWHPDPAAGSCDFLPVSKRHIQKFVYWRDRLISAKDVFDHSQPKGLLQFWRDDRNPVQWWTFWVAIVVFILTLVGVVEGALQVYKAYHPSQT